MMQAPALGLPPIAELSAALRGPMQSVFAYAIAVAAPAPVLLIALRWLHIVAGIVWVGLIYFSTLVNLPFLRKLEPATRARIYPHLMRPTLWWFRLSSVVTVFVGIWYWMIIIGEDKANALATGVVPHPGRAIGSFFIIWTLVAFLMVGILMMGKLNGQGGLLAVIFALLVAAAAWAYVTLNSTGWESNRQLCIGIGGGIGWVMLNMFWGVLWRAQKKILGWTESNPGAAMPPELEKFSRLSALTTQTNFWLSFPMLFFMAAASHYVLFLA